MKIKKFGFGICLVLVSCSLVIAPTEVGAFGGPAPKKSVEAAVKPVVKSVLGTNFVIDDFESGNLKSPQAWWTFDIAVAKPVANDKYKKGDKKVVANVGSYSLLFKGKAKNWYTGGAGTYLAKENVDLSQYNSFVLDVYGNGPGSGTLKIELLDDDNNNWQVEQDPAKAYAPVYDDKYVYDVVVDWKGWKKLTILFDDFVDDNANVGDDVWNPQQTDGSGGLLQLQFICLGAKDDGLVNINVDNIALSVSEE